MHEPGNKCAGGLGGWWGRVHALPRLNTQPPPPTHTPLPHCCRCSPAAVAAVNAFSPAGPSTKLGTDLGFLQELTTNMVVQVNPYSLVQSHPEPRQEPPHGSRLSHRVGRPSGTGEASSDLPPHGSRLSHRVGRPSGTGEAVDAGAEGREAGRHCGAAWAYMRGARPSAACVPQAAASPLASAPLQLCTPACRARAAAGAEGAGGSGAPGSTEPSAARKAPVKASPPHPPAAARSWGAARPSSVSSHRPEGDRTALRTSLPPKARGRGGGVVR